MSLSPGRAGLLLRWMLSAAALALVFHNVDLGKLRGELQTFEPRLLPFVATAAAAWWLLRTWRVRTMFRTGVGIPWLACFKALAAGALANLLLPLRSGDVLRCVVLQRLASKVTLAETLGMLMLEKALDFVAVLLVVLAWATAATTPGWVQALYLSALAACFAAAATAVGLRWLHGKLAPSPRVGPSGWLAGRLVPLIGRLREGWSAVSSRRRLGLLLGQTAAIRLVESATLWGFMRALDLPLGFLEAAVVTSFLALSMAIPAAPGFIGTYELAAVLSLGLFAVGEEDAVAFALLSHAWQFAVGIGLGLIAVSSLPADFRIEFWRRDSGTSPIEGGSR